MAAGTALAIRQRVPQGIHYRSEAPGVVAVMPRAVH